MAAIGCAMIALFATAFVLCSLRLHLESRWFLRLAVAAIPLPWIAAELGWFVAEHGRQPWVIEGILPTFLAISSVSKAQVLTSLFGFVILYSILLIVDIFLMVKFIKMGPNKILHKEYS